MGIMNHLLLITSITLFIMCIPGVIRGYYVIRKSKGEIDTYFTVDQSAWVFMSACISIIILVIWVFATIFYILNLFI
jgi:hypothetical protein